MKTMIRVLIILFVFGCNNQTKNAKENNNPAPLILISLDGFRWDYLERTTTPNFDYLISHGVKTEALIPVYPSYTFPNHLSIVTGCYPENHGIIANRMWDSVFGEWYYIGDGSRPVQDGKWYEAEPIWVTAEKSGVNTAVYHWPGSEAEIMGYLPSTYYVFDSSISNEEKITTVLSWIDLPENQRPGFMATYFNDANYYGHRSNVEGPDMDPVIQKLDHDIGLLINGLEDRELLEDINIMIVSDHGMVNYSENKVIFIDDYINLAWLEHYQLGPAPMLDPYPEYIDSVYNALQNANPHLQAYRKAETPEYLHYRNHRRIYPIVCLLDEAWLLTTHSYYEQNGFGGEYIASHGYDPKYSSMQGICIASGPQFKSGLIVPKLKNIHLYELMARVLDIVPSTNDGSIDSVLAWLK